MLLKNTFLRFSCVFLAFVQYTETVHCQQVADAPTRARADRLSGERRYLSYLLRLWQTQVEGRLVWRVSLEHAGTGERRGFASLADLHAFLEQEIALVNEDKPCSPPAE